LGFIVDKLLIVFVLSNVYLGTEIKVPRHDLLILNDGQEVQCQVQSATGGVIQVATNDSERTLVRNLNSNASRDMVEAGVFKTKRYSGKLENFNPDYLELQTYSGTIKVDKARVRKIIVSDEPSYNNL